jgi:hypothetical protein
MSKKYNKRNVSQLIVSSSQFIQSAEEISQCRRLTELSTSVGVFFFSEPSRDPSRAFLSFLLQYLTVFEFSKRIFAALSQDLRLEESQRFVAGDRQEDPPPPPGSEANSANCCQQENVKHLREPFRIHLTASCLAVFDSSCLKVNLK